MRYLGILLRDMDLTQKRLAAMLGWHPSRLSALIRGSRNPTAMEKITLQEFIQLPAEVIFEEVDDGTMGKTHTAQDTALA